MTRLTKFEQQKLSLINQTLSQAQVDLNEWLRIDEELGPLSYLSKQDVSRELVYVWDEGAEEYSIRQDHVAAVFRLNNQYLSRYDQTNWNDFPEPMNRLGGLHHCYEFHELYDHTYGSNQLSWSQIARLAGAYIQISIHHQREVNLYANLEILNQRSNQALALSHFNQILADEEINLRQALIEIDQAWERKLVNPQTHWLDYELTLDIWLGVDEDNPRYSPQNQGELAQIEFNAKGMSQDRTSELHKLGDGKIHSLAQFGVQLNEPCCFLNQAFQQQTLLTRVDYQYVDHIVISAEVTAKTSLIVKF